MLESISADGSVSGGLSVREHWCISEVEIFRDLTDKEMATIGSQAPARTVAAGQVVHAPTGTAQVLYIVKTGRLRFYRVTTDGRTVTTGVAGPGTVFGEMDLLGLRMGGTWAEAIEASLLCLMSRNDVRRLLLSDHRIATRITEQLGARVADLEERLTDVVSKNVNERVASSLRSLLATDQDRKPQPIKLTHEQLAQLVGTTRERATKALGELAELNLVRLRRGKVVVQDERGLAAYADGAYRASAEAR
ncbi:Crp/Fnr family transcriptional regulator [Haloechinothrix sp. LS1_15]|uniref:Crp/Fnr family transcriptional regulator n=1 Tax=Haloechinothrix sp. LS1_15 TaxID=2652248 RepID=UPI0029462D83|nr:Crp/Fnr family transcriptional regulator [Haloechinothrix sp. LS1_15]MDV6013591.1 Crp/Fnr family transcriptional regulator [Haloechinothrix sp. LS1_15]